MDVKDYASLSILQCYFMDSESLKKLKSKSVTYLSNNTNFSKTQHNIYHTPSKTSSEPSVIYSIWYSYITTKQ